MATTIPPYGPNLALAPAPFPARTTTTSRPLLLHRAYHNYKPFLRGSMAVARAGFNSPGLFPDPDAAESVVRDLFGRAESLLYTIADAAVSSSSDSVTGATKQSSDWLSGITYYMEVVLKVGKRKILISLILNGAAKENSPKRPVSLCFRF
jgi:YidC/Oxa1 family membrane protein insertase